MDQDTIEKELVEKNLKIKNIIYTLLVIIVVFVSGYFIFNFLISKYGTEHSKDGLASFVTEQQQKENTHNDLVQASLLKDSPKPLQDAFLNSVSNGENDKYAKSAAYFIMHRYFDNKGNIYELYDYANSDQKLAFLNEAEKIYPNVFQNIRDKKVPATFSEEGTYAYLAYLEILDRNGYADISTQGTAANQYAKMAYIGKIQSKNNNVKILSDDQKRNLEKAVAFASNASKEVDSIVKSGDIPDTTYVADVVIGLNQYAYALRYFDFFEIPFTSSTTPEEIFAFTTDYTSKKLTVLRMFTHLTNASSLAMIGAKKEDITKALGPILKYDTSVTPREYSVIDRIIKARLGKEKEGVYSKENIVLLASTSPEFKSWLIKAGWGESDF